MESQTKFNELSSELARVDKLEDGLQKILSAVIEHLAASKGNIQILDRQRGLLTIRVQYGFERDFLETFSRVSTVDDSACGRALRLRRTIVIEDTETDTAYAKFRSTARAAGYQAVISSPIMGSDGFPVGMISAHFP